MKRSRTRYDESLEETTTVYTLPWRVLEALRMPDMPQGPSVPGLCQSCWQDTEAWPEEETSRTEQLAMPAEFDDDSVTVSMSRPSPKNTCSPRESELDDQLWIRKDDRIVGPVTTTLVLLGIVTGRVPPDCDVISERDRVWRPLASTTPFAQAVWAWSES
jgi:hypothetical protein